MVQIGGFHIGSTPVAENPVVSLGEAQALWDFLVARYRCIEITQVYHHLAHDMEFKLFIAAGIQGILETQAREMEAEVARVGLPLPKRPAKGISGLAACPEFITDEFLFHQIYISCGNFFDQIVSAIKAMKFNDTLRKRFMSYLRVELEAYDDLTKYGKVKGWIEVPPTYTPH